MVTVHISIQSSAAQRSAFCAITLPLVFRHHTKHMWIQMYYPGPKTHILVWLEPRPGLCVCVCVRPVMDWLPLVSVYLNLCPRGCWDTLHHSPWPWSGMSSSYLKIDGWILVYISFWVRHWWHFACKMKKKYQKMKLFLEVHDIWDAYRHRIHTLVGKTKKYLVTDSTLQPAFPESFSHFPLSCHCPRVHFMLCITVAVNLDFMGTKIQM